MTKVVHLKDYETYQLDKFADIGEKLVKLDAKADTLYNQYMQVLEEKRILLKQTKKLVKGD